MSALRELHPLGQALLATLLTWSIPTLGAALVFTTKELSQRVLDGLLGFAAGATIFMVVKEVVRRIAEEGRYGFADCGSHRGLCGDDGTGCGVGIGG